MASRFSLILFQLLVVGGGLLIGYLTAPGDWYAQLAKPAFNPPGWIFAPVWTTLYVLVAISGWRVSRRQEGHSTRTSIQLWWIQLALNFLWSPFFFGMHLIGAALGILSFLFMTVLGFILATWPHDRLAAFLFIPYAIWIAFAGVLTGSIFVLN